MVEAVKSDKPHPDYVKGQRYVKYDKPSPPGGGAQSVKQGPNHLNPTKMPPVHK